MIIVYMSILLILGLLLGNLYTKIGITVGKKESILRINFGFKNLYRIADDIFVCQLEANRERRLRQMLELQKRFKESFE